MGSQLSLEGQSLLYDIQQRGSSEFEHGIDPEYIDVLLDRHLDFTIAHPDPYPETMSAMLPTSSDMMDKKLDVLDRSKDTQKEWHKYRSNAVGIGKPNGYTNRTFQERALLEARGLVIPREDPKEFYHYTPRHYADIVRNHEMYEWGPLPPELIQLDRAFAPIHTKASELMRKVLSLIEEVHPEVGKLVTRESLLTSPLRSLLYHPDDNPQLGGGHYDKSLATAQIAESHLGLRIAKDEDSPLELVRRDGDKAAVFVSQGLERAIGTSEFPPAWHDIVSHTELNSGRTWPAQKAAGVCLRFALIYFVNSAEYIDPDKSETHTR